MQYNITKLTLQVLDKSDTELRTKTAIVERLTRQEEVLRTEAENRSREMKTLQKEVARLRSVDAEYEALQVKVSQVEIQLVASTRNSKATDELLNRVVDLEASCEELEDRNVQLIQELEATKDEALTDQQILAQQRRSELIAQVRRMTEQLTQVMSGSHEGLLGDLKHQTQVLANQVRSDPLDDQDRQGSEMIEVAVEALEEGVAGMSKVIDEKTYMESEMNRALDDSKRALGALMAAEKLLEVATAQGLNRARVRWGGASGPEQRMKELEVELAHTQRKAGIDIINVNRNLSHLEGQVSELQGKLIDERKKVARMKKAMANVNQAQADKLSAETALEGAARTVMAIACDHKAQGLIDHDLNALEMHSNDVGSHKSTIVSKLLAEEEHRQQEEQHSIQEATLQRTEGEVADGTLYLDQDNDAPNAPAEDVLLSYQSPSLLERVNSAMFAPKQEIRVSDSSELLHDELNQIYHAARTRAMHDTGTTGGIVPMSAPEPLLKSVEKTKRQQGSSQQDAALLRRAVPRDSSNKQEDARRRLHEAHRAYILANEPELRDDALLERARANKVGPYDV